MNNEGEGEMKYSCLVLVLVFLSACTNAPSQGAIETAIGQTQEAKPTPTPIPTETPIPTPTLIPLSELNLEDTLIKPGDLPSGFSGGQISDLPPEKYKKLSIPQADQFISQQIEHNGNLVGSIFVSLFTSLDDAEKAYEETVINTLGKDREQVLNVGDKASSLFFSGSVAGVKYQGAGLISIRCHAIVDLVSNDKLLDKTSLSIYARRLIKRIDPLVCR